MATQKHTQKVCWQKFFAFLNAYKPISQLIKAHNSFDFSISQRRLSQNPEMPENDFKTCSTVNFPKSIQILEAWKSTKDIKFRLEFF